MNKFFRAIKKNIKVLFRLRTSLIAMVFGPLLVIALIGFAFSSSSQFQIKVGYSVEDNSTLASEFLTDLNEEYALKEFATSSDCVWELQQSLQHVCIEFPTNFVIEEGKKNNITFYVDQTRVNIAYAVLSSVSNKIGVTSDELSQGLTQNLVDTLDASSSNIDSNLGNLILLKKEVESIRSNVDTTRARLGTADLEYTATTPDVDDQIQEVEDKAAKLRQSARSLVVDGLGYTAAIRPAISNASAIAQLNLLEAELEDLNTSVTSEFIDVQSELATLEADIEDVTGAIENLESKLDSAASTTAAVQGELSTIMESLTSLASDVDTVKQNLERASQRIGQVEITSSEQIVNPITTRIQTVSTNENQSLVLFPYVLLLIVMFGGLMLASTLVVVEKKSRAFFRVFTTPTRSQFYIWTTFVTCFILILLQLIVIYVLVKFFYLDLLGSQLLTNSALIVIAISLFIMMGMAIGYLMKNQQGANMVSIAVGALFLFVSNIVLPLETLSPYLQHIAQFSPFVLATDVLRQSIIFQTPLLAMQYQFILLGSYVVVVFILITVFQDLSKTRFVQQLTKNKHRGGQQRGVTVQGQHITSEKEMLKFVIGLSTKQFNQYVKRNKQFRKFIREEVSDAIGRRSHKLTKEQFLEAMEKHNKEIIAYLEQKKPLHKLSKKNKNRGDKKGGSKK